MRRSIPDRGRDLQKYRYDIGSVDEICIKWERGLTSDYPEASSLHLIITDIFLPRAHLLTKHMSSPPMSPLCVPDPYLTEERLRVLFSEFKACLSHDVSHQSIFANLVNNVRQLYVSQILILQQDLLSRDTPLETEPIPAQQDIQLATQRAQLSAQREQEVAELTERHNRQLREMRRDCEVERSRWGRNTPSEWIVGIDVIYGAQESEKPPNRIMSLTGRGDSTNYGLSGK
ncbi:hypothetical protein Q9L58_006233 [Maublancomyces gigas]|uniref:Uncharacterized protein n=1 Tax=Discina gigas TaxID=1032678 RepID=A0ABR3GFX0_9PEZI